MSDRIVKLSFHAPVHFGRRRLSDSEYICDAATLFSALYIEALSMGCADDLLHAAKTGEIAFSDAFPYIGEQLYIPKPMIALPRAVEARSESSDSRSRKANKKLRFIPMKKLPDYLDGSFDFVSELGRFDLGASCVRTKVNLTKAASEDAEPYHVGGFSYNPGCGIYFIVRGTFDVEPLFVQLGFSGIGGKRSSGYGRFSPKFLDANLPGLASEDDFGKRAMLLSSSLPREDELSDGLFRDAQYRLEKKGGFVQSCAHAPTPRKKRDMWVFAPGSVFERSFGGGVFDVNQTKGAHPVYRYARSMWMEL